MRKANVIKITGEEAGTITLSDEVFGADVNADLIAQAILVRTKNSRLATRKTKDRGEVSGGGRKPWRQKGTGRARHGSIRSPIWVGGGHVHALRPGMPSKTMPQKMRRRALYSALSAKFANNALIVVEGFSFTKPETKKAREILSKLTDQSKVLVVTAGKDENVEKSLKNLTSVQVREARVLHPYEIVWSDVVVLTRESVDTIMETFTDK